MGIINDLKKRLDDADKRREERRIKEEAELDRKIKEEEAQLELDEKRKKLRELQEKRKHNKPSLLGRL